ncbi:MAG: sigma 54-interacting transcriptional regulator [Pirellulales bacterium]
MIAGRRAGASFILDASRENRIGRGLECDIVLSDPLCSRVHATLRHEKRGWVLNDRQSRNGTYINGRKVDSAVIADEHQIRVGSTEFAFRVTDQPPTIDAAGDINLTQTIIKDLPLGGTGDTDLLALSALRDPKQAQELLLLYQLSIKLLGCGDPREVVATALDLLQQRVKAAVVGFLWINEEGQLKSRMVIPEDAAEKVRLSDSLTELVFRRGHAVWVASQRTSDSIASLQHYADAICVPLLHDGTRLGAIHIYRDRRRFEQADFDFALSLANIMVVAYARAQRQVSLETDYQQLVAQSPGYDDLVGESQGMQQLKEKIARLAHATGSVLVCGESGSGKELVARAVHRASSRADRPMLTVNCAAIPADLMESQLFGHKAGSFTGADSDHAGYFQQADTGTLFLDEVGELTLAGQAKLLRILEGHPFHPVGGSAEVSVDVRVITATNQDLDKYVREKKFREDLYYRLSVFTLEVPPLRARGEDIALLIDFFLNHFRRQHGRGGIELSQAAHKKLLEYHWPGNVRQLRNVMDSAVVLATGAEIEPGDLGLRDVGGDVLDTLRFDFWERKLIGEALARTQNSVADAARLLGIGRATLYRKLDEYKIER